MHTYSIIVHSYIHPYTHKLIYILCIVQSFIQILSLTHIHTYTLVYIDFFCYGLPGCTLPLGDWDPWGFQLVSESVVRKYRESELKHGRLAMLASLGIITQETYHPIYGDNIGGLAITHMEQLSHIPINNNILIQLLLSLHIIDSNTLNLLPYNIPIDYILVTSFLALFEIRALVRNWTRWRPNEYNHQFDHHIGLGNLKEVCINSVCVV